MLFRDVKLFFTDEKNNSMNIWIWRPYKYEGKCMFDENWKFDSEKEENPFSLSELKWFDLKQLDYGYLQYISGLTYN